MYIGGVELAGTLNDTPLSDRIWRLLPYEETGETWGEQVYFPIELQAGITNPVLKVNVGDIGYWPEGPDLCLFFGRTPKSTDAQPVSASPVEIIGTFKCNRQDFHLIRRERHGVPVRVERVKPEPAKAAAAPATEPPPTPAAEPPPAAPPPEEPAPQ
jgi:uncharacterized protein